MGEGDGDLVKCNKEKGKKWFLQQKNFAHGSE